MKILAYINTYNRTKTLLPIAISSILNQTIKPTTLIIYDENKEFKNPLDNPTLKYLLDLSMEKGIQWHWLPGQRKGAHYNHETANLKDYDFCWFLDDDQVAEYNCLENLLAEITPEVGAVAGLIIKTPSQPLPRDLDGTLNDVWKGQNIQWYKWEGKSKEVQHLYSSFLYRPNISHWDLRLSKKSFRGETMFTHSLFLKGYKLIVTPNAITYHFEGMGGCRSVEEEKSNQEMYDHDNDLFRKWLGVTDKPIIIADNGLGDHIVLRKLLDDHNIKDITIACCYPEVFEGFNCISIHEATQRGYNLDDYNLYKWMEYQQWKGDLYGAYQKLYENIIPPKS